MSLSVEKILENRIAELEKKILGLENKSNANQDALPKDSVVVNLSQINSLLSSALSGREKINTLIQRLPELESYMESDFEPVDMQTEAKLEYIVAMEPEIREYAHQLNQLKELMPALENDRFKDLPEMTEKLHNLSLKYIEFGEQEENLNAATRNMITWYNDIITNICKTLVSLNNEITELENAAEPKSVTD